MNIRKYITSKVFVAVLGASVLTFSCTDLDEELYSTVTADNFFKSDDEFIAALGAAYSSLQGLGNNGNMWSMNELVTDEMVVTTKGGDWYDGGVLLQLHQHQYTPDNGFVNNAWTQMYGGVNTCNRLIYTFEQLGTPEANAFIAELRGVRALWYYWLLDAFGNVPIVTDFTDASAPANSERIQVYNFVESELNEIIDLLPTAKDASTYGRMTKWAALAIRCKLYLNAEVFTGTPQWEKAAADARNIIDNGPFNLELNYASNFEIDNSGSAENIFVYPYDKVFAGGFNFNMMTLHYASQGVYNFTAQPWNGYATLEEFYNSYIDPVQNPGPQGDVWAGLAQTPSTGTQDARLSNFIVGPQFNPDGTRAMDPGHEANDPDGAPLTFTPQNNEIYPNGWRQGGARIGKYEFEQGGTENMSNDFVIFRLADIILALAEAEFRMSNPDDALILVNNIRARAGVDPFDNLTEERLLAERGREMFAEMVRRQDLIRFGKFGDSWWEKGPSDAHYELFPIPQPQIDANNKLKQNPGYAGG
ncbi:MAG: RagB/SusD family nutrient uptake outer membrane protein [Cyclobacteriaceae bacterium]|nr:RagB/SusD family nutrient uptake outer membrane protein [Cyclobacteriaceae bacterium]